MTTPFIYEEAFSRNIGWVTEKEQQILRSKKVAIAGMGGVGGFHLLTLARLGIGAFHISDMDEFELANFNRQVGATMNTIGQQKVDTLAEMAHSINPEIDLKTFPDGISVNNVDEFLQGVDLYVDGLDFFVLDIRRKVFTRCAELNIPIITAAPIGMGTGYLIYQPGQMTFDDYFQFKDLDEKKMAVHFLIGLVPKAFHRHYLVDPTRMDLKNKKGPSTVMGCLLCTGVVGTESLKILLKRGKVYALPWYHHYDAYCGKWKRGWMPMGNKNPIQRLKCRLAYKMFS